MLFEVVTIDLHYMTDRQERFDLKISKLKILWKQRHLHVGCKRPRLKLNQNFLSKLTLERTEVTLITKYVHME